MSFVKKFLRILQATRNISLDGASLYGMSGETEVQSILEEDYFCLFNRIIPHPKFSDRVIEIDAIVWAYGNIFCIEVKNYVGEVEFKAITQPKKGILGWLGFTDIVGRDTSHIVKTKTTNRGNSYSEEFKNPLNKTKYFISSLKNYNLSLKNKYFIPLVLFIDGEVDINNIHSIHDGIIYASEIEKFFLSKSNSGIQNPIPYWLKKELLKLPTWDKVITRTSQVHYGILNDLQFISLPNENKEISFDLKKIAQIKVVREDIFSEVDLLTIIYKDKTKINLKILNGFIILGRFGKNDKHLFRNIKEIVFSENSL